MVALEATLKSLRRVEHKKQINMTSNTNNTVEFYWVEKDMLEEDNLVYVNKLISTFKEACIGKDLNTLKIVVKCDFASGTSESIQAKGMGDAFRMILTLRDIEDRLRLVVV
jgi:hypothetical protein